MEWLTGLALVALVWVVVTAIVTVVVLWLVRRDSRAVAEEELIRRADFRFDEETKDENFPPAAPRDRPAGES
jgi:Flp pilus assembly protein protease CpaA